MAKKERGKVRFIRRNGRVIPIRGKGSAPKGSGISKRFGPKDQKKPPVKKVFGKHGGAVGTALGAAAGAKFGLRKGGTLVEGLLGGTLGALAGGGIGGLKKTKRAKGETSRQTAKRVAMGNRAFNALRKKKRAKKR